LGALTGTTTDKLSCKKFQPCGAFATRFALIASISAAVLVFALILNILPALSNCVYW
jgi:hypothetical protein